MNEQNSMRLGALVLLVLLILGVSVLDARAEEYVDAVPPEPVSAVTVTDPDTSAKLDKLQESVDTLVSLLTPAGDAEQPAPTPAPAPDYSEQLTRIETTLSNIEASAIQATAETAEPAVFEKRFEDYSTTETLLLVLSAFALLAFFLYFVSKFF